LGGLPGAFQHIFDGIFQPQSPGEYHSTSVIRKKIEGDQRLSRAFLFGCSCSKCYLLPSTMLVYSGPGHFLVMAGSFSVRSQRGTRSWSDRWIRGGKVL